MTNNHDPSAHGRTRRVSTAEAKAKLSELVGVVAFGQSRVVIERRGRPVAALVSIEDAERLDDAKRPDRRRGALALVGGWADLDDLVIDRIVAEIYEARARDTGRMVDLSE